MSLLINILPYLAACAAASGGIARVCLFDPGDFDWTQAAPAVNGAANPYSAVARATGATAANGAKMFPISFARSTAEYTYKQSRKGCAVKYEHQLEMKMPNLSQLITTWNKAIDDAGCCYGVGLAIQLNSGKIFIAGERIVNGQPIDVPLYLTQDGSSGGSGKLIDDENVQTTIIKGDYTRGLFEFTGGIASILALA